MKRLALIAVTLTVGLALWAGLTIAQQDPWWDPRSPFGQSAGVTYGTQLPTLANTGSNIPDGLLAIQIASGAAPTLNMYDQSATAWIEFLAAAAGGITDDTIPVWDATNSVFEDSLLTDDGVNITLASGQLILPAGTDVLPALYFGTQMGLTEGVVANSIAVTNGVAEVARMNSVGNFYAGNGIAIAAGFAFRADPDTGFYRVGNNNLGLTIGGALVMDLLPTNVAGAGTDLVTISATLGIMDGAGDIVNALVIDLANVNHTGGNVNALFVDGITGDAEATESLQMFGDGFDYYLNDEVDTALGTLTWTTNADKTGNAKSGTLKVWINGTLYHIQLYADS